MDSLDEVLAGQHVDLLKVVSANPPQPCSGCRCKHFVPGTSLRLPYCPHQPPLQYSVLPQTSQHAAVHHKQQACDCLELLCCVVLSCVVLSTACSLQQQPQASQQRSTVTAFIVHDIVVLY